MPVFDPRLYRQKYRNDTIRMRGWDYAGTGSYFITICTDGRVPWFGEIRNGVMGLSGIGMTIDEYWRSIPNHFAHVKLDEFVVMPDHFHGIIIMQNRAPSVVGPSSSFVETCESHVSTTMRPTTARGDTNDNSSHHIPRPKPGSLGSIINQYKSMCTKRIRQMGHDNFAWQPRYHEHLIRSESEMIRIRKYIVDNPSQWNDK